MTCCMSNTKQLSEPMQTYHQLDPNEHISIKFYFEIQKFSPYRFESVICNMVASSSLSQCMSVGYDGMQYRR